MIRVKLVRVGHPARLLPQVLESALDAQVYIITYLAVRTNLKFFPHPCAINQKIEDNFVLHIIFSLLHHVSIKHVA